MSSFWFGQNWQQDPSPMDHEVSSRVFPSGFGSNITLDDDIAYRTNLTLEYCEKIYENETDQLARTYPGGYCNVTLDYLLCWPPTPFNRTAKVKCFSELLGIRYDVTQNASRHCLWNGTWTKSNYESCKELDPFSSSVETQINIYLIGYIISSITLAIAIFIFTYFKELRCLRNIIHMNLMWSYLLTYCMWIVILIELNFRDHMAVTCVFVVTLLHYFHITTFFWMFVEGLYLYILVVRTLTRESFKLRVYALIGWGTPMFFIVIWAVIKSFLIVFNTDACSWFDTSPLDFIYQVPTIIVLFVNIIFMISIMVVLVTKLRSANTLEIQQYRKAVKALAVLIPLLGVTYAITIYAPALTIWDMLRSGLLSVQGFMVALFYCFLNMEVQNTLKHHFENWKTKKSLGPSRLRSSSRSKDWSPRSRTESLRMTEWTLVAAEELEDFAERRISHASLHPPNGSLPNHNLVNQSLPSQHNSESLLTPIASDTLNSHFTNESLVNQPLPSQHFDSILTPKKVSNVGDMPKTHSPKESLLNHKRASLILNQSQNIIADNTFENDRDLSVLNRRPSDDVDSSFLGHVEESRDSDFLMSHKNYNGGLVNRDAPLKA